MTKTLRYILFGLTLCVCSAAVFAQGSKTDSLRSLLRKDKEDTNKVKHLNALVVQLMNGQPDTAIVLGNEAVIVICNLFNVPGEDLEEEIKNNHSQSAQQLQRLLINSFINLGLCYRFKADYHEALIYFKRALSFAENIEDKALIARCQGSIGVCYRLKGDYPKAIDHFLKALKIDEEMGSSPNPAVAKTGNIGTATHLGNIGSVYWNQGDYAKAISYYSRALKMNEALGDKKGIATNLGNSGSVYYQQGNYSKALEYYLNALKIAEEIGYQQLQGNTLGNIGSVYRNSKEYPKALEYYMKALLLAEELGDKNGVATQLGSIGSLYTESPSLPSPEGEKQKGYAVAAKYLHRALALSDSIGAMDNVKNWYQLLSELYEKADVPLPDSAGSKILSVVELRLQALYYMKRYIAVRDTLFSEENKKELLRKELNYEFEKKEAQVRAEQEKKDAVSEIVFWSLAGGLTLLLLFVSFIFLWFLPKRKERVAIEKYQQSLK